jgi:anthranilate phosphoribosyltransferase
MIRQSLVRVIRGENLSEPDMQQTMGEIFDGHVSPSQAGAFVAALRVKGETVDEITGAARALQSRAMHLDLPNPLLNIGRDDINVEGETILATSDTQQSGTSTFNISTATIFVAAGAGIKVGRHGSRAASTFFGAADVLMSLGINLDISTSDVERCIQEVGIGFLFTPLSRGPMRHVAGIREEIGIRTIFNLVGPLSNPVRASAHVLGVYEASLTGKMAEVLKRLDTREAFVIHGEGTHDEISICGPTRISRLENDRIQSLEIQPEDFGFQRAELAAIRGGSAADNARIIRAILDGEEGPCRDIVLLNAAAACVAAGIDARMEDGIARSRESIDSGRARQKLDGLVDFTARCAPFVRKEL